MLRTSIEEPVKSMQPLGLSMGLAFPAKYQNLLLLSTNQRFFHFAATPYCPRLRNKPARWLPAVASTRGVRKSTMVMPTGRAAEEAMLVCGRAGLVWLVYSSGRNSCRVLSR